LSERTATVCTDTRTGSSPHVAFRFNSLRRRFARLAARFDVSSCLAVRSSGLFDPKVAGSIPARPIGEAAGTGACSWTFRRRVCQGATEGATGGYGRCGKRLSRRSRWMIRWRSHTAKTAPPVAHRTALTRTILNPVRTVKTKNIKPPHHPAAKRYCHHRYGGEPRKRPSRRPSRPYRRIMTADYPQP
jgi:hypothetical protein